MLVVSNISKQFPGVATHLLKGVTFTVNAGECVGLIGPNGSGKSTLLKMINKEIAPSAGSIQFTPPSLRIGYLAQGIITAKKTVKVGDVLFPEINELRNLESVIERLSAKIISGDPKSLKRYDVALERLVQLSTQLENNKAKRVLSQLGIGEILLEAKVSTLSGGQKSRLMMASLLTHEPQLLLLDEPTNHLDVIGLKWLETWIKQFSGGILIVSHDRAFLDRVVNRIVAIEPKTGTVRVHVGRYSDYTNTLRTEREKQWAQWKDQEEEIVRLRVDAERTMARAIRKENATKNDHQRRLAKKVAHKAKAKEKRLERYLDADERVEKPGLDWQLKMDFENVDHIRNEAVRTSNLSIGYQADQPLLEGLNIILRGQERIAVMGPNGHGKSTLLKTIVGQIPPLSGDIWIGGSTKVGYLAQGQEILNPTRSALTTIQQKTRFNETEARSFLHFFLFAGDDPLRPIMQLSYGERARLMLALLVAQGANFLIMDEPLNHLDLPSREKFEQVLANFPGSVLAVAHDRYFVDHFAHKIWHIENGELSEKITGA